MQRTGFSPDVGLSRLFAWWENNLFIRTIMKTPDLFLFATRLCFFHTFVWWTATFVLRLNDHFHVSARALVAVSRNRDSRQQRLLWISRSTGCFDVVMFSSDMHDNARMLFWRKSGYTASMWFLNSWKFLTYAKVFLLFLWKGFLLLTYVDVREHLLGTRHHRLCRPSTHWYMSILYTSTSLFVMLCCAWCSGRKMQ